MKRKPTLRQLKDRCWKVFSEYIRRKDADEGGFDYCYTCRKPYHWKDLQCGHFVPGRRNAVLFLEEAVRKQCAPCNVWARGNYHAYTMRMEDEVGREEVERLLSLKHQTMKFTRSDLEEKIEHYKRKIEELG